MVSRRLWTIINISMGLIAVLLVLNLFGVTLPSFGQALFLLDPDDSLCIVNWRDDFTEWRNFDRCCMAARQHVECLREPQQLSLGETQWTCQSGAGDTPKVLLNNKAYHYCTQLEIWQ